MSTGIIYVYAWSHSKRFSGISEKLHNNSNVHNVYMYYTASRETATHQVYICIYACTMLGCSQFRSSQEKNPTTQEKNRPVHCW